MILLITVSSIYAAKNQDTYGTEDAIRSLLEKGKYDEAISLMEQRLKKLYADTAGNSHAITYAENNLATVYMNKGDFDRAEQLLTQVYHTYKSEPDKWMREIGSVVNNLCIVYQTRAQLDRGIELLETTLSLLKENGEAESVMYAMLLVSLAGFQRDRKAYDKSSAIYNEALSMLLKKQGEQSSTIGIVYNNYGECLFEKGDYHEAKELYEKSLKIFSNYWQDDDPNLAPSYNNLGKTHCKLGNLKLAEDYLIRARDMKVKELGDKEHPELIETYENLSELYRTLNDSVKAETYRTMAEDIRKTKKITGTVGSTQRVTMNEQESLLIKQLPAIESAISRLAEILAGVNPEYEAVVNYGHDLEKFRERSADAVTVENENYWKAFFVMTHSVPYIQLSRALLQMREGYLRKAVYNLHFAKFFTTKDNREYVIMFLKMYQELTQSANELVESGIESYDAGDFEKAMEFYEKALRLYPTSPLALYEIGLVYMTLDLGVKIPKEGFVTIKEKEGVKKTKLDSHGGIPYFKKVREYDPFFKFAYQGGKELIPKMGVIMKEIEPRFTSLYDGSIKAEDMTALGDAFVAIGQPEYAIYAYTTAFYGTLNETYDKKLLAKIIDSLEMLHAGKTGRFLKKEMRKLSRREKPGRG